MKQQPFLFPGYVLITLLLALFFAGCGNTTIARQSIPNSTPTEASIATDTPAPPTDTPTPVTPQIYHVGDTAIMDGWQVIVHSVKALQSDGLSQPDHPNDVFLEIDVSIKNLSEREQFIAAYGDFNVQDANGQTYQNSIDFNAQDAPDGNLLPNGTIRGTLVYEVPASIKDFQVTFKPSVLSNDDIVWNLSVK